MPFPENRLAFCTLQVALTPAHVDPEKINKFKACHIHSFLGLVTPMGLGENHLCLSDKGSMLINTSGASSFICFLRTITIKEQLQALHNFLAVCQKGRKTWCSTPEIRDVFIKSEIFQVFLLSSSLIFTCLIVKSINQQEKEKRDAAPWHRCLLVPHVPAPRPTVHPSESGEPSDSSCALQPPLLLTQAVTFYLSLFVLQGLLRSWERRMKKLTLPSWGWSRGMRAATSCRSGEEVFPGAPPRSSQSGASSSAAPWLAL